MTVPAAPEPVDPDAESVDYQGLTAPDTPVADTDQVARDTQRDTRVANFHDAYNKATGGD